MPLSLRVLLFFAGRAGIPATYFRGLHMRYSHHWLHTQLGTGASKMSKVISASRPVQNRGLRSAVAYRRRSVLPVGYRSLQHGY
jgi:hypothetical protein